MILDEAIIHCEIVAKSNEKLAEFYYKDPGKNQKSGDACQECAAEHRQLAEWLRDYKRLKEREPCEDAISRQAVKEQMIQYGFHAPDMTVMEFVEDLPSVNPHQKTGRWIDDKCSVCEKGIDDLIDSPEWYRNENPKFCPFCGVKMEIEKG